MTRPLHTYFSYRRLRAFLITGISFVTYITICYKKHVNVKHFPNLFVNFLNIYKCENTLIYSN